MPQCFDSELKVKDPWTWLGDPWLIHLILPIFYLYVISIVRVPLLTNSPNISLSEATKQETQLLGRVSSSFWLMGIWAQERQWASTPLRFFFSSAVIVAPTVLCLHLESPVTRFVALGSEVEELTFIEYLVSCIYWSMLSMHYFI